MGSAFAAKRKVSARSGTCARYGGNSASSSVSDFVLIVVSTSNSAFPASKYFEYDESLDAKLPWSDECAEV
ncbi:hypothetical protein D3C77_703250 [compost metagenome]